MLDIISIVNNIKIIYKIYLVYFANTIPMILLVHHNIVSLNSHKCCVNFGVYLISKWYMAEKPVRLDVRCYLSGFHVIFVVLMNMEAVSIEVFWLDKK